MVTVDDIGKLVTDRLAATAAVGTAVPGGIAFGRAADEPSAYPNGVFNVEAQDRQLLSENFYQQAWKVSVGVYAAIGLAGNDPAAVQQALHTALGSAAADTALKGASLRNATEKVLHGRPLEDSGEYANALRAGKDVFLCGAAFEVLVLGDRGSV